VYIFMPTLIFLFILISFTSIFLFKNSLGALGDVEDSYEIKDGKLILDFLQAIHAAEQRQAELDARVFAEEKRAMKVV
jgi:hypothetical protein